MLVLLLFFANVGVVFAGVVVVAFTDVVVVVVVAFTDVVVVVVAFTDVVVVFAFGVKRSGNVFARQRGASQVSVK